MAISNGDILRVVASLVFPDDVIMQNVFHLVATTIVGDGDEADITDDLEEYINDIYNEFEDQMHNDIAGDEIKVYEYDTVHDDWDEIGTGVVNLNPTGGTNYMPHGTAFQQNFFTLDPDVQGRKYWGGFTEQVFSDGDWGASLLAAGVDTAANVINTHVGTATGSTFQPVVWSPTQGDAKVYSGVVASNAIVSYQRRRKPGVGI